jgi:hypothetical protein
VVARAAAASELQYAQVSDCAYSPYHTVKAFSVRIYALSAFLPFSHSMATPELQIVWIQRTKNKNHMAVLVSTLTCVFRGGIGIVAIFDNAVL